MEFLETPQEIRQVVHNYVAPKLAKLRKQTDIDVDRYATTSSHLEEEEEIEEEEGEK